MEIKLHTYDIQKIMMCILLSDDVSVMSESDRKNYTDILTAMNGKCKKENDYTLTVLVKD